MRRSFFFMTLTIFSLSACAAPPASNPVAATQGAADNKLPHVQVDVKKRQVRVECESCNAHQDVGLEFFCVATGTNGYESVLASRVKASHLHFALLMIGLEPGEPVTWSEAATKCIPTPGPR